MEVRAAGTDHIELWFQPRWTYISCVRKFLSGFFLIGLADKERAEQISMAASELLENAVKYSSEASNHLSVRVSRRANEIDLVVENPADPQQIKLSLYDALEEIGAELAKLPSEHAPTRRDWARLSATWSARIDAGIDELERLKTGLTGCIGCGCLSLEHCKFANPNDRAARLGPGPRYWIGDPPAA